jgi:inner membrane protein
MDTITQAALGATIGLVGWREHGRRAAAFGALCGLMPDFDIFLGIGDDWKGLLTHRAWTHSLVVLPVLAVPIGWAAWAALGKRGKPATWIHLAFWALITHPLLDVHTTYGTQLLAPLSDHRFAIDAVAILDPIYTIPLIAALFYGLRKTADVARTKKLAAAALLWGVAYLGLGLAWTAKAKSVFEEQLRARGFEPVALRTPVAFFFPMLRHGAAQGADGRMASATIVPWAPERSDIRIIEPDDSPRIQAALESERGKILLWFSGGYLSADELDDGTIRFTDHRYGMYSDPLYSPFQTVLPADAEPWDLQMRHPRNTPENRVDPKGEVAAGWALVTGS